MRRGERYHREDSIKMIFLGQDRGELQFARNLGNLIFLGQEEKRKIFFEQDRGELQFARSCG